MNIIILFAAFVNLFFINLKYYKKYLNYFFWTNEETSWAFNTFNLGNNVKVKSSKSSNLEASMINLLTPLSGSKGGGGGFRPKFPVVICEPHRLIIYKL